MASSSEVTRLLREYRNGNQGAVTLLLPLVYAELHRMAARYMQGQKPGHALQTTALIHDAYVRLVGGSLNECDSRAQFFGVAAKAMRHILVDYARAQNALKRGGERRAVILDEATVSDERRAEIVALDDALRDLAKLHPRQSEVVELRYFAGLSVEETAKVLRVSSETVTRDWRAAKAWLHTQLSDSQQEDP